MQLALLTIMVTWCEGGRRKEKGGGEGRGGGRREMQAERKGEGTGVVKQLEIRSN